jgi:hypothetical protein
MKTKIRLSAVVEVILLAAMPALAADLAVGPGKTYPRIKQALTKAALGDTILVYPQAGGKPYENTAVFVDKAKITFRSVPGTRVFCRWTPRTCWFILPAAVGRTRPRKSATRAFNGHPPCAARVRGGTASRTST